MAVNHDTFTDVNGTLIEDHTPDTGGDWIFLGSPLHPTGLIVQDNHLMNPAGLTTEYVVDSGLTDCNIQTKLYMGIDLAISGVIFRSLQSTDSNDHFLLRMRTDRFNLIRYSSVDGDWTESSFVLGSNILTTSEVEIVLKGNSIKVYVDEILLFDVTDSALSAGVFHGFRVEQGTSVADSWVDDFGVFLCDAQWLGVNPDQNARFVEIDP
jgi:hypothetical protein